MKVTIFLLECSKVIGYMFEYSGVTTYFLYFDAWRRLVALGPLETHHPVQCSNLVRVGVGGF